MNDLTMAVLRRRLPASEKAVLNVYAMHADRNGEAFPSLETLVHETGLGKTTVCRALKALVTSGDLTLVTKGGGRKSSTYRISSATGEQQQCRGETAAVPQVNSSSATDECAIRNEVSYKNHVTKPSFSQGELVVLDSAPPQAERGDFSTLRSSARVLMPHIGLSGSLNEPTVIGAIDALMVRGWPDYHAACREIFLRVQRYRSRDGPKETRYFLGDGIFLNPESTWGIHGRPDTTQRYPRRLSATEARRQRIDDQSDEALRILRERRTEAGRDCRSAPQARGSGER